MIGFRVDVSGLAEALAGVTETQRRIRAGLSQVAFELATAAQADVDTRFQSAPATETGGPVSGGVNWSPLTPAYLQSHPRRRGGQIYRDTGEFQQSFAVNAPGNVFESSVGAVTFGSGLVKAGRLNELRPVVFASPELIQTSQNIVAAYVLGAF